MVRPSAKGNLLVSARPNTLRVRRCSLSDRDKQELSPSEHCLFLRKKAKEILDAFKAWMDKQIILTPPKGLLGKVLSYARTHWPKLIRYIEDGHITPDNNAAENVIRPFEVGRKNWPFAGHPNGVHTGATLFSLIETAKSCGLEPYAYLRHLFERLPFAQSPEDNEALLPQSLTPEQIA